MVEIPSTMHSFISFVFHICIYFYDTFRLGKVYLTYMKLSFHLYCLILCHVTT